MLTPYVWYSRQFNVDNICVVQQTVYCPNHMYSTADSLMLTQYVCYSKQFNVDTICVVQQTV